MLSTLGLLPAGFDLPPAPIAVGLAVVFAGVAALLWAMEPPVTDRTVLAFAPWMFAGAVMHVLHQQGTFPDAIAVLFSSPTVYVTTAVLGGVVWLTATLVAQMRSADTADRHLGIVGTGVGVVFAVFSLLHASQTGGLAPFWPVVGVLVAVLVAAVAWVVVSLTVTEAAAVTGVTGAFVVFGHSLDAVSTAIGRDAIAGVYERTPLSDLVMDAAAGLPTAEVIGVGWLFVLVKLALVMAILYLFTDVVREDPIQARLLLAFVAAVGFGPGVHNLLLFAVRGSVGG